MAQEEKPDIIILDLGLPDTDGVEVLREIRLHSAVPVVVLTGRSEEKDVVKLLEEGASDYIFKPFRQLELLARLKNQLVQSMSKSLRSFLSENSTKDSSLQNK